MTSERRLDTDTAWASSNRLTWSARSVCARTPVPAALPCTGRALAAPRTALLPLAATELHVQFRERPTAIQAPSRRVHRWMLRVHQASSSDTFALQTRSPTASPAGSQCCAGALLVSSLAPASRAVHAYSRVRARARSRHFYEIASAVSTQPMNVRMRSACAQTIHACRSHQ